MSKQQQEENKKVRPKVDLMPKYSLQRKCFEEARIKDIPTGKWYSWPYMEPDVTERSWNEKFLDRVVDSDTGEFYPKRDEDGKQIFTTKDNIPKYSVVSITRLKRQDGSEYLLSKGNFTGYDAIGEKVVKYVSYPEIWTKTHFSYESKYNEKKRTLEKICMGPSQNEDVYTLEFNEKNLKQLFDKREHDHINFTVKDEPTQTAKAVQDVNIQETFKLFLKPFSYLFNAEYMTPQQKQLLRQEAYDRGLIKSPGEALPTTAIPATPPKEGTYL